MKLSQLKSIVKEAVKEAIQEEMKEILIEAVRAPKQVVKETVATPKSLPQEDKKKLRENMMNVLDGMMPGNNGTLKRRFAVAKDTRGITLLKGEPSFSSSDQILIDELVFYIQQNNLKAN